MKPLPIWTSKYRKPGVAIHSINGKYYLYKISSKWDSKLGRSKKITGDYLGKLTPECLIPPKRNSANADFAKITVKEYGASMLLDSISTEIRAKLRNIYGENGRQIFSIAVQRFLHNSPIKNIGHHFEHSHMSDMYPNSSLSPKYVSDLMQKIGSDREKMVLFLRQLGKGSNENLIVDITHILSSSEKIQWLSIGKDGNGGFHSMLNMLLIFSNDQMRPIYFRILAGSIRDVSSLKETIEESQIKDSVFVGDKGFHSEYNVGMLEKQHLKYVLPIKRNNTAIDYGVMKNADRKGFDGYFFFRKKHVWYKEKKLADNRKLIMFFDGRLRLEEENDFLERLDKMRKNDEEKTEFTRTFYKKQFEMGTITVVTNTDFTAEKTYQFLKSRMNIEVAFDTFKNILEADRTYMRTNEHLYGWVFVNFISLLIYYEIYGLLLAKDLLSHFSPKDVALHFSKVYSVNLDGKKRISEIPKTTRILCQKMGFEENLLLKLPS